MPKHPEITNSPKPAFLVTLAGAGLAGSIYGGVLWVVLWYLQSSDITDWNAPYWKCAVTSLAVNALRIYDKKVFSD